MVGKILIVDDVATNRIVMKVKLAAAGYTPLVASDGASCLDIAMRELPDLILLDLTLPDMSGLRVLEALRAEPLLRHVPVVMVSANQDAAARCAAFRSGADEFLQKPLEDQVLLARIRSFMRARDQVEGFSAHHDGIAMLGLAENSASFCQPGVIAIITARSDVTLKLRRELAPHLCDRILAMTAEQAMTEGLHPSAAPDMFLIESDLSGPGSGLRLMSELRSRTHTRHAAFCVQTSPGSAISAAVAFDLGAHDLVTQSISAEELAVRLVRLLARKREADSMRASVQDGLRLAMIDSLTSLHNRRYGMAQLAAIADISRRSGQEFAVMLVDLDRFKSVNDRWGHAAGDAVLIEVADRLTRNLRNGDLLARIGGEEFLIALPDTSLNDARAIAERLCHAIEEAPVRIGDLAAPQVTVSIGLASSADIAMPNIKDAISDLMERADRALLHAKSAGRNQVTTSRSAA
ncbi:MAG: response regulator receiver modulated diguanylate cyclase [Cypionkella sp.]|uniref:diguanylate cyclase n=1 Tax=Cypionkella sp. TaxID=2811411 RepID=UPI00261E6DB4|nr:diguanylate cyclase [Cypionkella sp.]MDB5659499.1 response regulator receiver modulated diguanylate cyclase [Cypionkella sp.]